MPFTIVRDDITHVHADAIVNAANEQLRHGGGVCGAIFEAAGAQKLQKACNKIGHCDTGSSVATPAFALHARYVIHTVGPIWRGGTNGERELLESCYRSSLELAHSLKCRSIAFPLISAGIYGYPQDEALEVARTQITGFLRDHDMDVQLVLFNKGAVKLAEGLRLRVERYIDDVYVGAHARYRRREAWEGATWGAEGIFNAPEFDAFEDVLLESAEESAPAHPSNAFCPHCGEPLSDSDAFCPNCGMWVRTGAPDVSPLSAPESFAAPAQGDESAGWSDGAVFYQSAAPQAPSAAPVAATVGHRPRVEPPAPTGSKPGGLHLPGMLTNLLTHMDAGFSETLLAMIDERGLKDSEVYKRANLTRQHFSKIRSNRRYKPTKTTVLALAIALELSPQETNLLLERAGFALSHADYRDVIVEFFIKEGIYDVFQINEALFAYDQPLLG